MGYEDNLPLDTSELIEVGVSLAEATYDGLEMAGADEALIVTDLTAEDAEALEQGIVDMFETIRGEVEVSDGAMDDEAEDDGEVEPTLALLAELNRIWAQPLAA
jgi:hypothetical protein